MSLILAVPAVACLWDSDTLRAEAKGLPGIAEIVLGRIERWPAAVYEERLARVEAELAADPSKLEAYDDAAVACDRLGRQDEAIGWMERKRGACGGGPPAHRARVPVSGEPRHVPCASVDRGGCERGGPEGS